MADDEKPSGVSKRPKGPEEKEGADEKSSNEQLEGTTLEPRNSEDTGAARQSDNDDPMDIDSSEAGPEGKEVTDEHSNHVVPMNTGDDPWIQAEKETVPGYSPIMAWLKYGPMDGKKPEDKKLDHREPEADKATDKQRVHSTGVTSPKYDPCNGKKAERKSAEQQKPARQNPLAKQVERFDRANYGEYQDLSSAHALGNAGGYFPCPRRATHSTTGHPFGIAWRYKALARLRKFRSQTNQSLQSMDEDFRIRQRATATENIEYLAQQASSVERHLLAPQTQYESESFDRLTEKSLGTECILYGVDLEHKIDEVKDYDNPIFFRIDAPPPPGEGLDIDVPEEARLKKPLRISEADYEYLLQVWGDLRTFRRIWHFDKDSYWSCLDAEEKIREQSLAYHRGEDFAIGSPGEIPKPPSLESVVNRLRKRVEISEPNQATRNAESPRESTNPPTSPPRSSELDDTARFFKLLHRKVDSPQEQLQDYSEETITPSIDRGTFDDLSMRLQELRRMDAKQARREAEEKVRSRSDRQNKKRRSNKMDHGVSDGQGQKGGPPNKMVRFKSPIAEYESPPPSSPISNPFGAAWSGADRLNAAVASHEAFIAKRRRKQSANFRPTPINVKEGTGPEYFLKDKYKRPSNDDVEMLDFGENSEFKSRSSAKPKAPAPDDTASEMGIDPESHSDSDSDPYADVEFDSDSGSDSDSDSDSDSSSDSDSEDTAAAEARGMSVEQYESERWRVEQRLIEEHKQKSLQNIQGVFQKTAETSASSDPNFSSNSDSEDAAKAAELGISLEDYRQATLAEKQLETNKKRQSAPKETAQPSAGSDSNSYSDPNPEYGLNFDSEDAANAAEWGMTIELYRQHRWEQEQYEKRQEQQSAHQPLQAIAGMTRWEFEQTRTARLLRDDLAAFEQPQTWDAPDRSARTRGDVLRNLRRMQSRDLVGDSTAMSFPRLERRLETDQGTERVEPGRSVDLARLTWRLQPLEQPPQPAPQPESPSSMMFLGQWVSPEQLEQLRNFASKYQPSGGLSEYSAYLLERTKSASQYPPSAGKSKVSGQSEQSSLILPVREQSVDGHKNEDLRRPVLKEQHKQLGESYTKLSAPTRSGKERDTGDLHEMLLRERYYKNIKPVHVSDDDDDDDDDEEEEEEEESNEEEDEASGSAVAGVEQEGSRQPPTQDFLRRQREDLAAILQQSGLRSERLRGIRLLQREEDRRLEQEENEREKQGQSEHTNRDEGDSDEEEPEQEREVPQPAAASENPRRQRSNWPESTRPSSLEYALLKLKMNLQEEDNKRIREEENKKQKQGKSEQTAGSSGEEEDDSSNKENIDPSGHSGLNLQQLERQESYFRRHVQQLAQQESPKSHEGAHSQPQPGRQASTEQEHVEQTQEQPSEQQASEKPENRQQEWEDPPDQLERKQQSSEEEQENPETEQQQSTDELDHAFDALSYNRDLNYGGLKEVPEWQHMGEESIHFSENEQEESEGEQQQPGEDAPSHLRDVFLPSRYQERQWQQQNAEQTESGQQEPEEELVWGPSEEHNSMDSSESGQEQPDCEQQQSTEQKLNRLHEAFLFEPSMPDVDWDFNIDEHRDGLDGVSDGNLRSTEHFRQPSRLIKPIEALTVICAIRDCFIAKRVRSKLVCLQDIPEDAKIQEKLLQDLKQQVIAETKTTGIGKQELIRCGVLGQDGWVADTGKNYGLELVEWAEHLRASRRRHEIVRRQQSDGPAPPDIRPVTGKRAADGPVRRGGSLREKRRRSAENGELTTKPLPVDFSSLRASEKIPFGMDGAADENNTDDTSTIRGKSPEKNAPPRSRDQPERTMPLNPPGSAHSSEQPERPPVPHRQGPQRYNLSTSFPTHPSPSTKPTPSPKPRQVDSSMAGRPNPSPKPQHLWSSRFSGKPATPISAPELEDRPSMPDEGLQPGRGPSAPPPPGPVRTTATALFPCPAPGSQNQPEPRAMLFSGSKRPVRRSTMAGPSKRQCNPAGESSSRHGQQHNPQDPGPANQQQQHYRQDRRRAYQQQKPDRFWDALAQLHRLLRSPKYNEALPLKARVAEIERELNGLEIDYRNRKQPLEERLAEIKGELDYELEEELELELEELQCDYLDKTAPFEDEQVSLLDQVDPRYR